MSAPPYMPLYVADYLGDTTHLNAEEHGAYLLLLMALWRSGGRLPKEGRLLAKYARVTPARWAKLEDDILAFFDIREDHIGHARLERELNKYVEISAARAKAGAAGGRAKSLKNNDPPVAEAEQNVANQNQNQSLTPKEEPDGSSPPQGVTVIQGKPAGRNTKEKAQPKVPMPVDWTPDIAERLYATEQGLTDAEIDRCVVDFRDYFVDQQTRRPGWTRSWQRWCREHVDRRNQRRPTGGGFSRFNQIDVADVDRQFLESRNGNR